MIPCVANRVNSIQAVRKGWAVGDFYRSPGPIQFDGPGAADTTIYLRLELGGEEGLQQYLDSNQVAVATGSSQDDSDDPPANKRLRPDPEKANGGSTGSGGGGPKKTSNVFVHRPRDISTYSALQQARIAVEPELPPVLQNLNKYVVVLCRWARYY